MSRLGGWIDKARNLGMPRALPVLAYSGGGDTSEARSAALGTIARTLGDEASLIFANDFFVLLGATLMVALVVAARVAHAPQL